MAPEICVEVVSPSNSEEEMVEKRRLYFEKGAKEVWIVSEAGTVSIYECSGPVQKSRFNVSVDGIGCK